MNMPESPRQNPYGYFDTESREYVITRPDTPTPWINYLGEGQYGGIISNTAGGYSFDRDPRNRRVTRYRYNGIPADQPGRYVYLRDQETGEFWSPTWQPIPSRRLEGYECRHGAGYTRIQSAYQGIQAVLLYFVPPLSQKDACPCELWVLHLKNLSNRMRRLRSFSYAEYSFYDALIDQQNLDWGMHIVHTEAMEGTLYTSTQFRPTFTFFSSSAAPLGFDSDREAFIGRGRDLSNPVIVESGEPRMTQAPRGNNIGSLCHDLILAPGEEKELVFMLGVADEPDKARRPERIAPLIKRYSQGAQVQAAFQALQADWESYLSCFAVQTPDPAMNAMLNFWNPVQCRTNLYWSRFVSAYDTGLGRGMGTRDSAQDTLGTVHNLPGHARDTLSSLWKLQFQDGHTWHQVFPLTGEGGPGLAGEFPQWLQWFSDDHLWLVIATCAYLRETGDFQYLEEPLPYQDGNEATVWGHVQRAVAFTLNNRGPHGLPRIGFSDWDDTMNLDHGSGKAESVWTAEQFCRAMLDLADLCHAIHKKDDADRFLSLHHEMAEIVNKTSWDGEWYARAYDDEGLPVGVSAEKYHRINLNPQTWAVIGELGDLHRAQVAMQSAHEYLNTPFGLRLMYPPYDRSLERVRGTTTFPPGAKENGGIFCHANTWAVVAAASLGWGDLAYQYYRQFLPLARNDADTYLAEPYVYAQNISSPEHPQYGMGRNSWLTGTAAWTYVAGTQWILGIRPTFQGLQISPVIPENWQGFSARRLFREVQYNITVVRTGKGNSISLEVDAKPVQGNIVPLPSKDKKTVDVKVTLY